MKMDLVETVRAAYAAFGPNAVPYIIRVASLEVEVELDSRYPGGVPIGGKFRGHQGVVQFFRTVDTHLELLRFEPLAFYANDGGVAVLGRERARVRETGLVFDNDWVHVWTFDAEGMLTRIVSHNDTLAVAVAFAMVPPHSTDANRGERTCALTT